jgi:hypothetical protein
MDGEVFAQRRAGVEEWNLEAALVWTTNFTKSTKGGCSNGGFHPVVSRMRVVTTGFGTGSQASCRWGTPEALKRVALGAKQPRVKEAQGGTYAGRGCSLPGLRTAFGVRIPIQHALPRVRASHDPGLSAETPPAYPPAFGIWRPSLAAG